MPITRLITEPCVGEEQCVVIYEINDHYQFANFENILVGFTFNNNY